MGKTGGSSGEDVSAQDVLHSLSQAIFLIGPDNLVEDVYAQAETIFERSRESLCGSPIAHLRGVGYAADGLVTRAREENTPLNSYDVSVMPPIGDIELMDMHAHPHGEGDYIILSVQPRRITAFLEKRAEMEAAARSVSGLASMLAHEIKNPLSGIRGAAQLMARAQDSKNVRLTELIVKEVDRIKGLVDELETFSSPHAHTNEAVNIHEVLDHVLSVAVAGFAAKCSFRPRFDPSLPPVFGNYDRLVQVFLNLVKNAVEAAGPTADITITTAYKHGIWLTSRSGERIRLPVEVTVQDNGPGIPTHLRGHLFDPFVSGKEGGTGLGLALVARYVSDMEGTVTCDNHPQGGAHFKVQLALEEDMRRDEN
ncbi:two-component system sensor histidine kinase NtrB [Kordiimonas gwangyangensis]|uniref:two-component system sensor histidine kinase NtrB n=2 Tax=Kordiimonas gwangyangensis TaxID=288022 RepID=UPI000373C5A4|nr:ATP-binding protein [Kordiimonas gwangyangensis]